DTGPNPYELLLASLGSCTSMTLMLYARRKQWPLDGVVVRLRHHRSYVEDCASCEDGGRRLDLIERSIEMKGALSPEQRQRLMEIADLCPVHKTLSQRVEVRSTAV